MGPSKQLVALRKAFEDKEVKDILERARWSFGKKLVLKEGVEKYFEEVERYGWVEREEAEKRGVKRKREEGEQGDGDRVLEDAEMEERLKVYKEKYTDVTVAEWDREAQTVKIEVQSPAALLKFAVRRRTVKDKAVYDIKGPTCEEENRSLFILFAAIDRCLESRPHPNDLGSILVSQFSTSTSLETPHCSPYYRTCLPHTRICEKASATSAMICSTTSP